MKRIYWIYFKELFIQGDLYYIDSKYSHKPIYKSISIHIVIQNITSLGVPLNDHLYNLLLTHMTAEKQMHHRPTAIAYQESLIADHAELKWLWDSFSSFNVSWW